MDILTTYAMYDFDLGTLNFGFILFRLCTRNERLTITNFGSLERRSERFLVLRRPYEPNGKSFNEDLDFSTKILNWINNLSGNN